MFQFYFFGWSNKTLLSGGRKPANIVLFNVYCVCYTKDFQNTFVRRREQTQFDFKVDSLHELIPSSNGTIDGLSDSTKKNAVHCRSKAE